LNNEITFKQIWLKYAITAVKFNRDDLACPACKVRKNTIMAWYKHITNYHSDNPTLSRENVKEILVRKFSQINPPKPKPIQESVSY